MKKMHEISRIKLSLVAYFLTLLGWGGVALAEVSVSINTSGSAARAEFTNNTNSRLRLGGVRYITQGGRWTSVGEGWMSQHISLRQGEQGQANNETEMLFKSTATPEMASLLPQTLHATLAHPWQAPVGGWETLAPNPNHELELLLKWDSPGRPDRPDGHRPITLDELRELVAKTEFYDPAFRYTDLQGNPRPDSLGSLGGRFSGGMFDTWNGETQLLFAVPTGNLPNFSTTSGIRVESGQNAPQYWLSIAMGQELFDLDAQLMFALGAKESWSGTTGHAHAVNWATNNGVEYALGHMEHFSLLDRAMNFPQFFPRHAAQLATHRDATTFMQNVMSSQAFADFYVGRYNGRTSPKTANGMLVTALFWNANFEILSRATNVCWRYLIENQEDRHFATSLMLLMWNRGATDWVPWANNNLNSNNVNSFVNDPNARDRFGDAGFGGHRTEVISIAEALENASTDFMNGGNNSQVIDFGFTLAQLREMFFGENGTPTTMGDGGLLLHYYDLLAPGANVSGFIEIRQRIWDNLGEAFAVLLQRPGRTGLAADQISFRFDFLSAIRAVKADISFNPNFEGFGHSFSLINESSSDDGCDKDGSVPDEIYPRIMGINIVPDEDFCHIEVSMIDNAECREVKWTLDPDWSIWHTAAWSQNQWAIVGGGNFEFSVPAEMAQALGRTVWIMGIDVSGNAVVVKRELKFDAPFKRPVMRGAAILDTAGSGANDYVDGYANLIKARITPNNLSDLRNARYSWTWNGVDRGTINPADINVVGADSLHFNIATANVNAGSGRLIMEYDTLAGAPKAKDTIGIMDWVGPVIIEAGFYSPNSPENPSSQFDMIEIELSEPIEVSWANGVKEDVILVFAKDENGKDSLEIAVADWSHVKDNTWQFTYNTGAGNLTPDTKLDYTHVRMKQAKVCPAVMGFPCSYIIDASSYKNGAHEKNPWVALIDHTLPMEPIADLIFSVKSATYKSGANPADGYIDTISVIYEINRADGKAISQDFSDRILRTHVQRLADSFVLPQNRHFTVIGVSNINLPQSSFDLVVWQDTAQISLRNIRTNTDGNDIIRFSHTEVIRAAAAEDTTIRIVANGNSVQISDGVAPVITHGFYRPSGPSEETDEFVDTLTIFFSEPVSGVLAQTAISAFSLSQNREYEFNFVSPQNINDSDNAAVSVIWRTSGSTPLVMPGDSVKIKQNGAIRDRSQNEQNFETVWAHIDVAKYESDYVISIFPNPFSPKTGNFETADGARLAKNPVVEKFGFGSHNDPRKMAVMIKPTGRQTTSGGQELRAKITLIDPLGNTVVKDEHFEYNPQHSALIWTWSGKNSRGRIVGAGYYLAVISITDRDGVTISSPRKIGVIKE